MSTNQDSSPEENPPEPTAEENGSQQAQNSADSGQYAVEVELGVDENAHNSHHGELERMEGYPGRFGHHLFRVAPMLVVVAIVIIRVLLR